MKIIDKQTIRVPLFLSVALIIFSINIYGFFAYFRENELYSYLKTTGIYRSRMLFDSQVSPEQMEVTDVDLKESQYLQKKYIIYDSIGTLIYKSKFAEPHLSPSLLKKVFRQQIEQKDDGFERVFFITKENFSKKTLIIEAEGYDLAGFNKQRTLLFTLILTNICLITLIALTTRFYIGKDLRPIGSIAKRMKKISTKNLQQRIPESNLDNEIGDMAHTFNELLDRLDSAYSQQRNFVSYVTHELRTPLSILLGNTQVSLMKERTLAEYKEVLEGVQYDANNMINLVNSLLELARMNADAQSVPFTPIRVDDTLWSASESLKQKQPTYKINIEFEEIPEDIEEMMVKGNAELLLIAFRNIMENGCKYSSNNKMEVKISATKEAVSIIFSDEGVGIPTADLAHIFEPFYRSDATKTIAGHGVGLPLTKRIVEMHAGTIEAISKIDVGTTFTIILPLTETN